MVPGPGRPVFMPAPLQFWGSPHLVAHLLNFLDVSSTLAIVKVLPLAQDLLQRKSIWRDLLFRSVSCSSFYEEEKNKSEVAQFVEILKMVRDPDLFLLQELLDTICRRFRVQTEDTSTSR